MSAVLQFPEQPSRREMVADTVRAELARRHVSVNSLRARIGGSQSYWSRRVNAELPFSTDDLDDLGALLGIHPAVFVGGAAPAGPPGPGMLSDRSARSSTDRASDYGSLVSYFGARRLLQLSEAA